MMQDLDFDPRKFAVAVQDMLQQLDLLCQELDQIKQLVHDNQIDIQNLHRRSEGWPVERYIDIYDIDD